MSTLIPSITTCKLATPGERRFARHLEAKLEDDYYCWYNVPIGPKRLHPDFIIMHPQRGIIMVIKDLRIGTIQTINQQAQAVGLPIVKMRHEAERDNNPLFKSWEISWKSRSSETSSCSLKITSRLPGVGSS